MSTMVPYWSNASALTSRLRISGRCILCFLWPSATAPRRQPTAAGGCRPTASAVHEPCLRGFSGYRPYAERLILGWRSIFSRSDPGVQAVNSRRFLAGPRPGRSLASAPALLALCAVAALADTAAEPRALTPDQRAIIEQIAKPSHRENLQYAGAPADPIGTEVKLPFRDGKLLTLVRTRTTLQKDGSVAWVGQVEETCERALLMLWSNALLTGYFAYKGTIYTVESLGGGVHAFSETERNKLPGDHPPVAMRDGLAMPGATEPAPPRPAPVEPAVAAFADARRQELEAKDITIDVMVLFSSNATKYYV